MYDPQNQKIKDKSMNAEMVEETSELSKILSEYRTKNFVIQKLQEFSDQVSKTSSGRIRKVIEMPKNLVAMTIYYQFSLFEIP